MGCNARARASGVQCQLEQQAVCAASARGFEDPKCSPGGETKAENRRQQWGQPLTATHPPATHPRVLGHSLSTQSSQPSKPLGRGFEASRLSHSKE